MAAHLRHAPHDHLLGQAARRIRARIERHHHAQLIDSRAQRRPVVAAGVPRTVCRALRRIDDHGQPALILLQSSRQIGHKPGVGIAGFRLHHTIIKHQPAVPTILHDAGQSLHVGSAVRGVIEHITDERPVGIAARRPVAHGRNKRQRPTLRRCRQLRHVAGHAAHRPHEDTGHVDLSERGLWRGIQVRRQRESFRLGRDLLRRQPSLHHHHRFGQRLHAGSQRFGGSIKLRGQPAPRLAIPGIQIERLPGFRLVGDDNLHCRGARNIIAPQIDSVVGAFGGQLRRKCG